LAEIGPVTRASASTDKLPDAINEPEIETRELVTISPSDDKAFPKVSL
jgi:hypothetical protein